MSVRVRRRPGRPLGGTPVVDRDALLDAAERVITRDGSGASLEAIALEAGVTKPIVYARVGGRADLSNALAIRLADRMIAAAGAVITNGSRLDRPTLSAFIRTSLDSIDANRELFLYVTRGAGDDTPERTLFLAERSARPLADLLSHWRTRHGHDPSVALPWAYAIIGMLNLVSLWWITQSEVSAQVLADQLSELVWTGLVAGT